MAYTRTGRGERHIPPVPPPLLSVSAASDPGLDPSLRSAAISSSEPSLRSDASSLRSRGGSALRASAHRAVVGFFAVAIQRADRRAFVTFPRSGGFGRSLLLG